MIEMLLDILTFRFTKFRIVNYLFGFTYWTMISFLLWLGLKCYGQ
jgi:hypothetical protein